MTVPIQVYEQSREACKPRCLPMFARQCAGHGVKVNAVEDFERGLAEALPVRRPALVEVMKAAELV